MNDCGQPLDDLESVWRMVRVHVVNRGAEPPAQGWTATALQCTAATYLLRLPALQLPVASGIRCKLSSNLDPGPLTGH
jgi:hypothetical protein